MKSTLILIILLIVGISIIFGYLLSKKNITESLLVSPVKLYNGNNSQDSKICEIDNNNQNQNEDPKILSESDTIKVFGYADYITISDYISIKNKDPKLRPGSELIGKKVRILLPLYTKEVIPSYITEEEDNYCTYSPDYNNDITSNYNNVEEEEQKTRTNKCNLNNNQNKQNTIFNTSSLETLNKQSSCYLSQDQYSSLETDSSDKRFSFSDYYKIQGNQSWYDANIINYTMTNYPCSMHKLEWKNQQGTIETKWLSLHDFEIEVPIKPHNIYFKNEIGNITSNNPYYFWRTEMDISDEESNAQNNCASPISNNLTQNAYLNKNYFGNISCSNNQECHKYGSLYCDGGFCSTKYIQL